MSRLGRGPIVLLGLLTAGGLVRCSSFTASTPPDGLAPDASADSAAGDAGHERTGIACPGGGTHCAVGERCCAVYGGTAQCAASCDAVDGSFYDYECGQKSDCANGQECCIEVNGDCTMGYAIKSSCVPTGNCQLCGAGGGGNRSLGCNPKTNDDCPAGHPCTRDLKNSGYTGCSL